jgi:DNA-binding Lrp family transcriptional regulator
MIDKSPKLPYDELDEKIILELQKNARISASDIAKSCNANERTIRKRIDRLVALGAIRLTAVVNPQAFNYVTAVDVFLEVAPDQADEIVKKLAEMPEISYIAYGQELQDISIEARFKDNAEMLDFLRYTLPAIPGVKVARYTLVPRILRNIDEWKPRHSDFY